MFALHGASYIFSRIADDHGVPVDIFKNHAAHANEGAVADFGVADYRRVRAQVARIPHNDPTGDANSPGNTGIVFDYVIVADNTVG